MSNRCYRYRAKVFRYRGLPESGLITVSFFLESTRSISYSPYSVNVTETNELLEVYKTLISAKTLCFMTFFLILSLLPIQKAKRGICCISSKWIPRYIDMNPHFSQNILNKGIFQMWIHHYIDMNPHLAKTY